MNESNNVSLSESYARIADFYQKYAQQFKPGTLGYTGNLEEAAKYSAMSEHMRSVGY